MFDGLYERTETSSRLKPRVVHAGGRRRRQPQPKSKRRAASVQLLRPRGGRSASWDELPRLSLSESASRQSVPSALEAYLRDAGQVSLLTPEQEVVLAARIQGGDVAAREQMIRANLRLVVKIARDYEHLGLPLLDLISEGAIGLMKAVDKFEPAKGGKLSTYGCWWIKQQIRRALANQGRTIRLPVHIETKLYQLSLAEVRLREALGRSATEEELAAELQVSARRVRRLRLAAARTTSLDAPVGEGGDETLGEFIGDERVVSPAETFERRADQRVMLRCLEQLPPREARILRWRFGLGGSEQTLEAIGARFGLTRERIRQLEKEALKKLRTLMESTPTRDCVPTNGVPSV